MNFKQILVLSILIGLQAGGLLSMEINSDDVDVSSIEKSQQEHADALQQIEKEEWSALQVQVKKWVIPGACGLAITLGWYLGTKKSYDKTLSFSHNPMKIFASFSTGLCAVGAGILASDYLPIKSMIDFIKRQSGKMSNKPISYKKWNKKYRNNNQSMTFLQRQILMDPLPLHKAVCDGNMKMIESLVKSGTVNISQIDASGYSALYYALAKDRLDIANFLIDSGADLQIVGDYTSLAESDALYEALGRALPHLLHGKQDKMQDYIAFMKKLQSKGAVGKRQDLSSQKFIRSYEFILNTRTREVAVFKVGGLLWPLPKKTIDAPEERVTEDSDVVALKVKANIILSTIEKEVFNLQE